MALSVFIYLFFSLVFSTLVEVYIIINIIFGYVVLMLLDIDSHY